MQTPPTFSFVIPVRNEGVILHETLAQLQRTETEETWEIVVIDDGSDRPQLDEWRGKVPLVYHRSESRLGVAKARNLGASKANGNILIFIDAHVSFSGRLFDELLNNRIDEGVGIFGCTTRLLTDHDEFVGIAKRPTEFNTTTEGLYYGWTLVLDPVPDVTVNRRCLDGMAFQVPYVGACTLALSHDLFDELGGFDEGLVGFGSLEDAELAMRCWSFGKDVKVIPSVTCNHYSSQFNPIAAASKTLSECEFDHPRYEGSFLNSLRVMALHLPEQDLADILMRLKDALPGCEQFLKVFDFRTTELVSRRRWIDSRRTHSREWLIKRMTHL